MNKIGETLNETLRERFLKVEERITAACQQAGRSRSEVKLVAVSKTKPLSLIQSLAEIGHSIFGENYVQEATVKISSAPNLEWHFIGSLQSNKARSVAGKFALVHSVDRLKLASALNLAAEAAGLIQPVLIQIHIGDEETKHGFTAHEASTALVEMLSMKHLSVRGLMSLPPLEESESKMRKNFASLRDLREALKLSLSTEQQKVFSELSMGTSSDFEAAILEGATLVRVGTDIFGERESK